MSFALIATPPTNPTGQINDDGNSISRTTCKDTQKSPKTQGGVSATTCRPVTQVTASERIGVDDSTVNRWTNDDRFFQFFQLLAACELKIADVNDMLIDKEMQKAFPATMRMAANWMEGQLGGYGDGE